MRLLVALPLILLLLLPTTTHARQVERWARELAAFDAADHATPPAAGEIVFVGSSSIARWDVARSFPDLKIINRGISGSELADAVRLIDRLVIVYAPRLVVVYAGDNDIANGHTSEEVAIQFERFVDRIHATLPQTRIVYIGIKPSLQRWALVERMRAANALIRAYCEHDDRVAYVDVDDAMLGWDEKPRHELFVGDGLHLTADGYQIWTFLVRPFLN